MNTDKSALRLQIEGFILLTARILFYTSNAASFYIFYIVSESFRREFKEIVCKHFSRAARQSAITSREAVAEIRQ